MLPSSLELLVLQTQTFLQVDSGVTWQIPVHLVILELSLFVCSVNP